MHLNSGQREPRGHATHVARSLGLPACAALSRRFARGFHIFEGCGSVVFRYVRPHVLVLPTYLPGVEKIGNVALSGRYALLRRARWEQWRLGRAAVRHGAVVVRIYKWLTRILCSDGALPVSPVRLGG